ncbi:MAG: tetratricopeptide repeat protein [Desulfobacteraceae bacterium]|nr:tetratricopeptide repeat protein [Desulfobacteraceae bacterium]
MHPSFKIFFICMLLVSLFNPVIADEIAQNYYDLGVFAYEEGNFKEAGGLLQKTVSLNPDNARANYYLGQTYAKLDQPDEAEFYLTAAFFLDPQIPGLKYSLGRLFFEKGDYGQALEKFEEVAADDPENVLAIYYSGISRYKLAQYDAAGEYLVKAARMSPTIKGNGYYYAGVCDYHLGRFDEAVKKFEHVMAVADSEDMKENARSWAQSIKKEQSATKPYCLYLKTGYLYDDNVVLEPADLDIVADESDSAFMLYFSGKYDVIVGRQVTSGIGYSHYQTRYQDLEEYDLTGSIGNVYLNYKFCESVWVSLKYLPTYYWVDSESYLMQHQVKPSVLWMIDNYNAVDFSYSYYRNNYFTDNSRDGHSNEMSADYSRRFSGLDGYVFCGVGYEINSADGKDQDFSELKTLAGISYDIFEKTNITVYANYYDKQYDDKDILFNIKRDDSRYFASASITQNIWKQWLNVSAEYTFTKNNSNIAQFDYERNAMLLSVSINL